LNMPFRGAGSFTTSKLPDAQAMQQSMMSMMSAIQSGVNFNMHAAGYLDGLLSMSYEKFMMDADVCGALHAYAAGVDVNEDTLGFEALAQNGPGEHLFGTDHTMRHYKTAYWDTALNDDQPWETWDEEGEIDHATRANTRWKESLAKYEAPPLDVAKDEELKEFISRKKASMEDAWY